MAILIAFCSLTGTTGVATAQISTCGVPSNYFDGYSAFYPATQYEGVLAYVTVRNSSVCDTVTDPANNFTTAWTMIADNGGGKGYAQSGYLRGYNQSNRHFAEQNQTGAAFVRVFGGYTTEGVKYRYWQQWLTDCYCIHSNVDTTRLMNSSFNPYTAWTTPFSEHFRGEAIYRESDVPGSSANPVVYSQMQVETQSETFQSTPCPFLAGGSDSTRWGTSSLGCDSIQIYTK